MVTKVDIGRVAKNSSIYQLKDCPWAVVRAFADSQGFAPPNGQPPSDLVSWSASTFLQSNTVQCTVSSAAGALAVDKSSTGEVAVSVVFERDEQAGPVSDGLG